MDYEKAYKKLVGNIKNAHLYALTDSTKNVLENILPELKESEDEKIREDIISLVNEFWERIGSINPEYSSRSRMLAWLEKQGEKDNLSIDFVLGCLGIKPAYKDGNAWCILIGDNIQEGICGFGDTKEEALIAFMKELIEKQDEQKPTDKVEPKFKVGDWLIFNENHNSIYQVKRIDNYRYYLRHYLGGTMSLYFDNELIRLWTIQDAKDGDVLCCESGWTCIFKSLNSDNISFSSYCFMDSTEWFCEIGSESHTLEKAFIKAYNGNIYPATKEQRNLLFQKMHEKGYEWDAEQKELKKIKQKPA